MRRILVTGMSGTGKSTALAEVGRRGFRVVDTDEPPWSEWSEEDGGYVWREDLIAELLAVEHGPTLYLSGTVSNQGRFYPQLDAVVLLSAPADVLLRRLESRTTNDYGKSVEERRLILGHLAEVEPLLRASCTHEIDATQPVDDVVAQLVEIGRGTRISRATRGCGFGIERREKPEVDTTRRLPMANPVPAGSDVSSGTYRCTKCGNELEVSSTKSLPPCPSCGNGQWETVSGGDSVQDPYPDS